MNLITVDITSLREKLADYLILVRLGKAEISVRNAKSKKEIARIVSPVSSVSRDNEIEKRIAELKKIAGFAAGYPNNNRKLLRKMDLEYVKKLKKRIIE